MSTTLPPAAALGLVLALPPLLLLLQPTAAKAIAAKAAIAVVRLMIFLSLFEVVRLPPSALTGPLWAHGLRQPEGGRCAGALTAARPPRESMARDPRRANVAAGTSAADSPTLALNRAVRGPSGDLRVEASASSLRSASPT